MSRIRVDLFIEITSISTHILQVHRTLSMKEHSLMFIKKNIKNTPLDASLILTIYQTVFTCGTRPYLLNTYICRRTKFHLKLCTIPCKHSLKYVKNINRNLESNYHDEKKNLVCLKTM